uniref:Small ribosomal subunit protein uS14 n=1 Tax=Theropithecus gelada TaxID=9565 RepID=A0A8D2FMS2_THEGE
MDFDILVIFFQIILCNSHSCHICSNWHGLIRKYGLHMCHQCFRQYVKDIGFIKLD